MTTVRLAVWDEIQEAIHDAELKRRHPDRSALDAELIEAMTKPVTYEIVNGLGEKVSTVYATMQGVRGCALCSHAHTVHSQILPFEPCLDCDCIGWTVLPPPPNPSRRDSSAAASVVPYIIR